MAGTMPKYASPNNILYAILFRLYAARVIILWIMTVLLALGFVTWGYIGQFCEHCELEDMQRGKLHHGNGVDLHRRDQERVTLSSNSCLSVKFAAEGSQEQVALPSYPGSGNTWLRHLIESSTGIYTGSVYKDKKLASGGFNGEQVDYRKGTVLGVKMHRCSRRELQNFQAIIYLIRNPFNAMVSEWHRYHTSKHVSTVPKETFQTEEWEEFVEEESSHWERMMTNCIRDPPRTLVVFYENLQSNLLVELTRIHRFLRVPIDTERLKCTQQNVEGNFHRATHTDFDPYTAKMVEKINGRIERAVSTVRELTDLEFPVEYRRRTKS